MNEIDRLLQDLIRIPSVNPDDDPDTAPGGEKKVAEYVAAFLEPLGFEIVLEEISPNRPNLIARAPGPDGRPRILLGPHLDTVGIAGMSIDPFSGEISNGKIHGRGASDTKGPMAAMLWGLRENAGILAELPVAVDFVAFMGEESNQPGSIHFAKKHAHHYQFAIVGEPTSLHAVHSTKGCLWATIEARGIATHASQPQLGENAILKLARALIPLQEVLEKSFSDFPHPLLGAPTLNIGTFHAGTRPNIVPDLAQARLDIRTNPEFVKNRSCEETLAVFLKEIAPQLVLTQISEYPPMQTPADNIWLQILQKIHPQMKLVGAPWFSDAAHLAAVGLPSICLGPGSIDQAHTKDEFINQADLRSGASFFSKLIRDLSK